MAGVRVKTLSRDRADGAATEILQVSAGFRGALPTRAGQPREWFVLDGDLELGGVSYRRHGYGFESPPPASLEVSSAAGATLLWISGSTSRGIAERVSIPDTFMQPWSFGAEGSVTGKPLGEGIATKVLRRDPGSGEQTFLYCAMPQHSPPPIMVGKFTHPVIEELFVLDGSYVFGDVGRMGPGGYAFWRENQWHGPAGSETGYHLFIRVIGGPLRNQFSSDAAPFSWHPPYRPALPAPLRALAREHASAERW